MRGFLNMLLGRTPKWQQSSRDFISPKNAVKISQRIADSGMTTQDKMSALNVAQIGIRGNESLTLDQQDRALAENIIASERVAAEAGNISWEEFYQYEREARQDVEERIATRHSLRSGL